MDPAAPGRCSTMIVAPPSCPRRRSAASRVTTSEPPPAVKPTTMRSARSGQASTGAAKVTATRHPATIERTGLGMIIPPFCMPTIMRTGLPSTYFDQWKVGCALALLVAQLLPVFQPLQNLALEAALDRLVELLARHAVGGIVLAGEAVLGVVVVFVALAVAAIPHQPGRRNDDMHMRS